MSPDEPTDRLLAEQMAYYDARAHEYDEHPLLLPGGAELASGLEAFAPHGDVLELACGTGTWTTELLRFAVRITALDASPAMLALARRRVDDRRVRWIEADVLAWTPDARYDVVTFAFWLSHVPLARFAAFWDLVDRALKPSGRVLFVDDAYRTSDELIEGEGSEVIERRLSDGRRFRAVKVPHSASSLQDGLAEIGWNIAVKQTRGPFFIGSGTRG